jgi:hypothetical protein
VCLTESALWALLTHGRLTAVGPCCSSALLVVHRLNLPGHGQWAYGGGPTDDRDLA